MQKTGNKSTNPMYQAICERTTIIIPTGHPLISINYRKIINLIFQIAAVFSYRKFQKASKENFNQR